MKLTNDDLLELRFLSKRGPAYPKMEPGSDQQLDRLAGHGLIERFLGFWRITPAGRSILDGGR